MGEENTSFVKIAVHSVCLGRWARIATLGCQPIKQQNPFECAQEIG